VAFVFSAERRSSRPTLFVMICEFRNITRPKGYLCIYFCQIMMILMPSTTLPSASITSYLSSSFPTAPYFQELDLVLNTQTHSFHPAESC
jgi:hypothetical protein